MKGYKKYHCPICLGAKEYFTGKIYTDCDLCDEDGMVSKDTHELYEGEEI